MNGSIISKIFFAASFAALLFSGCGGSSDGDGGEGNNGTDEKVEFSQVYEVTARELSDAESINLINGQGEQTTYMGYYMQPALLGIDFKSLEIVPVIAKELPKLEVREDGKLLISYEIREEAAWDNGETITAKDIEFTLKVIKNPKVDNQRIKPYFEFIEDIIYDAENPKKFTFVCKEAYMLAENGSGDFGIHPAYIYDPEGIMEKFTLKQLSNEADELANDEDIVRYANFFNSEKFSREVVAGAGAYELEKWETNERMILKKKESWWGDNLKNINTLFPSPRPDRIIFETINDDATAITALKAQKVDVMRSIDPKIFVKDFPKSDKINKYFNLETPNFMAYEYIGLNMKNNKLKSKETRRALAHIMDVSKIIETIYYGLGARTVGFIHPSNKKFYHTGIEPYSYDIAKAKEMLAADGWEDSDGNGTLDKEIDGERVEFTLEIIHNAGNARRQKVCLIFQEEARKAGIAVSIRELQWAVFLETTKKHDFEAYIGGWVSSVVESDPKQIWHTDSYNDGSNYVGFGTAESDLLIEDLRKELDATKRAELYKRMQEILHEDVPYIFLNITKQRLAIHKRFSNAYGTEQRPGYWRAGFRLASADAK